MGNEQVSKTKNANDKTLEDIDEEMLYPVSERKEIYVCINATIKEHDCKFGLCRDCYCKHAPSRSSRKRKKGLMTTHHAVTNITQLCISFLITNSSQQNT